MADTKQTWVSIAIAACAIVVFLVLAAVGGTALFVYRHVDTRVVPSEAADVEIARARARFAGQTPMIEIQTDAIADAIDDEPQAQIRAVVHRERVAPGGIHALHVLAYDPRANKLVHADIPRWVLDLTSFGGRFRVANLDLVQRDGERVTLADFDRRGPGLVLSVRRPGGGSVVVWTD